MRDGGDLLPVDAMDAAKESLFGACGIGYGDQRMWNAIREVPELLNQVCQGMKICVRCSSHDHLA